MARVLWTALLFNLLVATGKLLYGAWSGALSVTADGFHSLLDAASSIVGLVGIQMARRPPDEDHHYGHQKFEILSAMGISLLLFLSAYEIVVEAFGRMDRDVLPVHSPWGYALLGATLLINSLVFRMEQVRGKELSSPLLLADAEHTRSDILATIGVLGSLVSIQMGTRWIDLFVALAIGVIIARAGYRIIGRAVTVLTDSAAIDATAIEEVLAGFPGALHAHKIRSRGFEDQIFIDLHMHVEPEMSLREAHDLSERIEKALQQRFRGVTDVVIHVEPHGEH
ncbi:MAG: cation diffusion facilitator family transporter [Planctomycetota bacterium]